MIISKFTSLRDVAGNKKKIINDLLFEHNKLSIFKGRRQWKRDLNIGHNNAITARYVSTEWFLDGLHKK